VAARRATDGRSRRHRGPWPPAPFAALLLLAASACGDGSAWLTVTAPAGEPTRLRVRYEVASTAQARRDGLATRPPLAASEGLLLVFPLVGEVCISNAQVDYAIDVVFVGEEDTVLAAPSGLDAFEPGPVCQPSVRRVLELRRGVAATVELGDLLLR
jgi:uncharacterized membrane protein (UPF0127 family)